jgi:circadian clock protein KaiB
VVAKDPHIGPDGSQGSVEGALRLVLYIAGGAPPSEAARSKLSALLQELRLEELAVDVVDVLEHPDRALKDQIFVTPTLIRHQDTGRKVLIGDLRDETVLKRFLGV